MCIFFQTNCWVVFTENDQLEQRKTISVFFWGSQCGYFLFLLIWCASQESLSNYDYLENKLDQVTELLLQTVRVLQHVVDSSHCTPRI